MKLQNYRIERKFTWDRSRFLNVEWRGTREMRRTKLQELTSLLKTSS